MIQKQGRWLELQKFYWFIFVVNVAIHNQLSYYAHFSLWRLSSSFLSFLLARVPLKVLPSFNIPFCIFISLYLSSHIPYSKQPNPLSPFLVLQDLTVIDGYQYLFIYVEFDFTAFGELSTPIWLAMPSIQATTNSSLTEFIWHTIIFLRSYKLQGLN